MPIQFVTLQFVTLQFVTLQLANLQLVMRNFSEFEPNVFYFSMIVDAWYLNVLVGLSRKSVIMSTRARGFA
jgi:hypothetical protein